MTYDNGIKMARHEKITQNTGIQIFFPIPTTHGKEAPTKTQMYSLEDTFLKEQTLIK